MGSRRSPDAPEGKPRTAANLLEGGHLPNRCSADFSENAERSSFARRVGTLPRPEPVLVDLERPDLGIQCLARDPELGCGAGWPGDSAVRASQGSFDNFFLTLHERATKRSARCRHTCWLSDQPGLVYRERLGFAKHDGALDHVLELANIAWPVVRLKASHGCLVNVANAFARPLRIALDEVGHEHGHI